MSFMDAIIGTALTLIIFLALTALLRSSLTVASLAKNKTVATAVAESQMEYVRSLDYASVGTVGGIPAGSIPQYATTTSNGVDFITRTYIEYVDDPADGIEAADENGITTDYKRIKVEVTYTVANRVHAIDLLSNYAPPGIETTTGGGTLRIQVVNAAGAAVPGASVRIENPSVSPAVDLTAFASDAGIVYLPGASTSTDYRISVSKDGYSSAQTYERNATNQNPTPGYLTVAKDQTTTGTFAIDLLASLVLSTFSPVATTTWTDTFDSSGSVASQSGVSVGGGSVTLASDGLGGYVSSGSLRSSAVAPTYLAGWSSASMDSAVPGGTTLRYRIVTGAGIALPDSVLPGNSTGFTGTVDLRGVPVAAYPSLALAADLDTSVPAASPSLLEWSLVYRRGPVPLPNVAVSLMGAKTIGSTGAGAPIYKTEVDTTTDASGTRTLALEWDAYAAEVPAYDVVDACNAPPYVLAPGASTASSLIVATSTPNAVLVSATLDGAAMPGASVTLSRLGYSETVTASACGTAYFGDIAAASDYAISATASGASPYSASSISVSGQLFYALTF